jgi:parvulin-like peptidyl-prolyl isomerase
MAPAEEQYFSMKRIIICVVMACACVPLLPAQVLDKPAATVRLTKTESITVSSFQKTAAAMEAQAKRSLTAEERKQLLDALIGNIIIIQAAARDNVVVSEAEMKNAVAGYQQQMGQMANLGRSMSDAELQQYVKSNGITYDAFLKQLRDQQTVISYVRKKKPAVFENAKAASDQEVQDYYDANKSNFFMNDMVTVKHIYVDTRQLTSKDDRDKAAKHADDILKELKAGAVFADLVMKYSEDNKSKYNGGLFNTFFRNDAQNRQFLGAAFFDSVFKLKKGETSGVLQSNLGFHIIQVTEKLDARLLSLTDKIPPQNQMSVKDAINATLVNQRQADNYKAALSDIMAELKKQAEIKVFDDNINW